jgi:hypothetical protein
MIRSICFVVGSVLACQSVAGSLGLGVQVDNDGYAIYFPYDIDKSWMLEPYFAKDQTDEKSSGEGQKVKSERDFYELGVGTFMKKDIKSDISLYWGARISYIYSDYTSDRTNESEQYTFKNEEDGYELSPVLGFRYFFNERFSIAGEAEISYRNTEAEDETRYDSTVYKSKSESKSTYTSTNFVARYMF